MIDADLDRLANAEPDACPESLVSGLWTAINLAEARRRMTKTMLSAQVAVMVIAAVGSLIQGERLASANRPRPGEVASLAPGIELAPSNLLMGAQVWAR